MDPEDSPEPDGSDQRAKRESTQRPSITWRVPTFPAPVKGTSQTIPATPDGHLTFAPGTQVDDFSILDLLGKGAFGSVYLARQLSLDRLVALKVSLNKGEEARTMARLEHPHIVQVFSEKVLPGQAWRILCMQFVPGTTLETYMQVIRGADLDWNGQALLDVIDQENQVATSFDPSAAKMRHHLSSLDRIQTVCWVGSRIADALAYAHRHQVLHRDIKPANILLNQYGQPLLADFNLSFLSAEQGGTESQLFGGTLAYMAPEHLDAFNPDQDSDRGAVDCRSDTYALGVVLYEFLHGDLPFVISKRMQPQGVWLSGLSEERKRPVEPTRGLMHASQRALDHALGTCLQPRPEDRYQDVQALSEALKGVSQLRAAERRIPEPRGVAKLAHRWPFAVMVMLIVLPHLPVGSVVNISYNVLHIVNTLSESQRQVFVKLVWSYNLFVYPLCIAYLMRYLGIVWHAWTKMQQRGMTDPHQIDAARKTMLRLPAVLVAVSCVGWFPGGLFFPLALQAFAGPLPEGVFAHFLISCTLSGLVALTYSYFGLQTIALGVLYPQLWGDVRDLHRTAEHELQGVPAQVRVFQVLAGLVPLAGALLVVGLGPGTDLVKGYPAFRFLVMALIGLGLFGFQLANLGSYTILRSIAAITRAPERSF